LLGFFALLLLLIPYAEAAPPLGGVSPTPPPDVTATVLNLSVTKEALSPSDSTPLAEMPTALPAPLADMPTALPAALAAATPDNTVFNINSPLDLDIIMISSDETSDAVAANAQDDEWRAAAAAQGMAYCVRGTLSDSDPNSAGINDTLFGHNVTGLSISYSLREMNDEFMGSLITGEEDAQGIIENKAFMKEAAPIPQELLDLGEESIFEEQVGSTNDANGLLFTFNSPGVKAFGAWFGGLASRAPLEGAGLDGDPRGGKLAYMRLFDAEGRKIGPDRPIRPAQKEGESLCLGANGERIECGSANTRWIGFVASQPIAQMLLVVGDHDDSDEQMACRVEADGGSEADFIAQCQAGEEHLSFVGPTICSEAILEEVAIDPIDLKSSHSVQKSMNSDPILLQLTRDRPMQSLALTGAGISLIGLLGFWWRKRR